jgi:transcription-repair coupling factor (superfamily II helicase)
MDWTTPLRAQQADFIQRLKSGYLLHCQIEGQHSELTVISGERLKQLRDFCWQMAEKYKRMSPVREVFINNMKGKLAEEVVKARLAGLVTEVDYEKRLSGDGKVDFRLTSDPSIGIQVKARHGSIDSVQWRIDQEEIAKNAVLVCILIQEEVHEAQTEYNLIIAGFLQTEIIELSNGKASVGIDELLYSGGLRSYLESFQVEDLLLSQQAPLQQIMETQYKASTDIEFPQVQLRQQSTIEQIWQDVLEQLQPLNIRYFLGHHSQLLSFDSQVAHIGISSQPLLMLAQSKLPNIEAAFETVFTSKIQVILQTKVVKPPISSSSSSKQQQKPSVQHSYKQNWEVGDCVIHEYFGRGRITHVFGSGTSISLGIRFPSPIGQKIIDPTRAAMHWIESESF